MNGDSVKQLHFMKAAMFAVRALSIRVGRLHLI
jgi:hypothetical protein